MTERYFATWVDIIDETLEIYSLPTFPTLKKILRWCYTKGLSFDTIITVVE